MGDAHKKSASLILFSGKGNNLRYNLQAREIDKSNHPRKDLFQFGKYCYYSPGAVAIPGGVFDFADDDPTKVFIREIKEEKGIDLSSRMDEITCRCYNWKNDLSNVLGEIEDAFQGNFFSVSGFNLDDKIPSCALGPDREKTPNITYREWLTSREGDYYFSLEVPRKERKLWTKDNEGAGAGWILHQFARAFVMISCDKLALCHDIALKVKDGSLDLKVLHS